MNYYIRLWADFSNCSHPTVKIRGARICALYTSLDTIYGIFKQLHYTISKSLKNLQIVPDMASGIKLYKSQTFERSASINYKRKWWINMRLWIWVENPNFYIQVEDRQISYTIWTRAEE